MKSTRAEEALTAPYFLVLIAAQHELGTNASHRPVPARGGRRPAGGTNPERSAAPRPAPAAAPPMPSAQRAATIRAAGQQPGREVLSSS